MLNDSNITSNETNIKDCNFYIITVPTPLKNKKIPDLSHLEKAYQILSKKHDSYLGSIYDFKVNHEYDLAFTYGVLIHQEPKKLNEFYSKLFSLSRKYILICENISHKPVMVKYRGNNNKMFKRDFGKDFWEKYPNLKLVDYGFFWSMDEYTRSGDANWFLFRK